MTVESSLGRLIVTGADGFVGRHLLTALRAAFPRATLIAAARKKDLALQFEEADEFFPFDLLDGSSMAAMIAAARPDGLVHLAAQASVGASFADPITSWHANLLGTVTLAEAVLRNAPACRFILASSAEVYGLSFGAARPLDETAPLSPANPYAASKAACDLAIGEMTLRGLDAVRLRAFNHIGRGQSPAFVVAAFARQIALIEAGVQAPVMQVGQTARWRDLLDVRDVCAAYVAALRTQTASGSVFNIASGEAHHIGGVLDALLARTTIKPRIEVETRLLRPTDVKRVVGNAARARIELDWAPTVTLEETLDNVMDDWRNRVRQRLENKALVIDRDLEG